MIHAQPTGRTKEAGADDTDNRPWGDVEESGCYREEVPRPYEKGKADMESAQVGNGGPQQYPWQIDIPHKRHLCIHRKFI